MFYKHLKTMQLPYEKIYLQQKSNVGTKDNIGNNVITWEDIEKLTGSINEVDVEKKNVEGEYDETGERVGVGYTGYFMPFNIDNMQDYRIKRVFTNTTPHTIEYYDIIEYNRNLCFDMFLFPLLMNYNDFKITWLYLQIVL